MGEGRPAGRRRRRPREGEGAEGRGARRCPGLICRYCGSGGGRRAGRGRAAERDRVTPAWAGGVCGERRGAKTPSPVKARQPSPRGPGLPLESGPEAGVVCGSSPETSSSSSCCFQVPPQPLACPRPSRPPPSPASPFRRKAPLSAAGRVESAPGPRRFRQWGWTAISALGRFRRRGPSRPATLLPELAGLGRASREAPWGSEFSNFRGAGRGRSARVGPPPALGGRRLRRAPAEPPAPLRKASPGAVSGVGTPATR